MNDELIMRMWNADHARFSADFSRMLGTVRKTLSRRRGPRAAIEQAYAGDIPGRALHRAGNTLLGGLAAVATTAALFVILTALAAPSAAHEHSVPIELAATTQAFAAA
jgi:hypothetical protein